MDESGAKYCSASKVVASLSTGYKLEDIIVMD
jgi:hypothetical protein